MGEKIVMKTIENLKSGNNKLNVNYEHSQK